MLSESDLRELLDYSAPEPVLSVYLNTDPVEGNADAYKLRLRNMLKEIDLPQDVEAVEQYLNREYDWSGKSVAMFSCAPQGFFRAFPLGVPIRSRVRVSQRPSVKGLADVLDAYGGYGVVLVDKQGARAFLFNLGKVVEQTGTMGEEIRHTKRGGASSMPGRMGGIAGRTGAQDETIDRNMKDSVEFAVRFFEEKHVRRILIGGTEDNVAHFRGLLPKAWQSLVVGSFPMSMTANNADIMEKAMQVGMQAEHHREVHLIDVVITSAAKGAGGVVRLDDTLSAVHDGRVQVLLVMDGFRQPGYRCTGCGYLTTQKMESCPFCGKAFDEIEDAVEMAVRAVMADGGEVEIIHSGPALEEVGRIGAILRY